MNNKIQITKEATDTGHVLVMIEVRGRIYAAKYNLPLNECTDEMIRRDISAHGYGKNRVKGFLPYNQSTGTFLR